MASFVLGFQEVVTTQQPGVGSALSDSGPALSEDDAITQSGTYVTPTSFHLHQLLLKHFQTFQTIFQRNIDCSHHDLLQSRCTTGCKNQTETSKLY